MKKISLIFVSLITMYAFGIETITCTSEVTDCDLSGGDPHEVCTVSRLIFNYPASENDIVELSFFQFEKYELYSGVEKALTPKNLKTGYPMNIKMSEVSLYYFNESKPCEGLEGSFVIGTSKNALGTFEIVGHHGSLFFDPEKNLKLSFSCRQN